MKIITKIRNILKQHGVISDTDVSVWLVDDTTIEVRIRYNYIVKERKGKRSTHRDIYTMFRRCLAVIKNQEKNKND